jgi:hypothetical protein
MESTNRTGAHKRLPESGLASTQPPRADLPRNVNLYVTHQEVFGEPATINQLTGLLVQLNINDVIRTVAVLKNLCMRVPGVPPTAIRERQLSMARSMFYDEALLKLEASPFGKAEETILFHPQQQLFLLRHALMTCPQVGGLPWDEEAHKVFGEACLVASDLLVRTDTEESSEDGNIIIAHLLAPLIELSADREPVTVIGRAIQLWQQIPADFAHHKPADYVDIGGVFEKANGVSVTGFFRILFLVFAQVFADNPADARPGEQFVFDTARHFENVPYDPETIRKAMAVISCPLKRLGTVIYNQPKQSMLHDFTAFQQFPAIEVEPGIHIVYDRELLLTFFTAGMWWRIHDALDEDDQKHFRSFFGLIYETYVERVFDHASKLPPKPTHRLIPRPKFNPSTEVCDLLIVADDCWVMVETKGSVLSTRAKYSEDASIFRRELEGKFYGKPSDKKGVYQIAHSIKKLAAGETIMNSDLDFAKVKRIYMVVVCYDLAATGKFAADHLDGKMRREFDNALPTAPTVLPLTMLSSTDIESFTALAKRHLLPHLLASYRVNGENTASFKDHIFGANSRDVSIDDSFSMLNFKNIFEAVYADLNFGGTGQNG